MAWTLYDFIDTNGANSVKAWLSALNVQSRAKFRAKLDAIKSAGPELPPKMITPTKEAHINEIVANGKAGAFRLFVCRGPGNHQSEMTLLCGGQEKNSKYVRNGNAPSDAERMRLELNANPTERRCKHEF